MQTVKDAKAQARILKKFMAEQGVEMTHGVSLEAIARLNHHKTWAQFLLAADFDASFIRRKRDVQDWPVFVFTLKEESDDSLDEVFHVLPGYATLDNRWQYAWGVVDDSDAVAVADLLKDVGANLVVKAFQSRVPRIDKYGLPWYADESRATQEVRAEFGFAALSSEDGGVDVSLNDSGDDSASRVWFEAYVEPKLASQLQARLANGDLEDKAYRRVLEQAFGVQGLQLDIAKVMNALQTAQAQEFDAQQLLSQRLDLPVELTGAYEGMTARALYGAFRRLAKQYCEELLLAQTRNA